MDKKQVIEIVSRYKEAISLVVPEGKVYLYGSYSKGTARKDSDIDVAVIVPKLDDDWLETSAKLWGATWEVNTLIEPILLEQSDSSPLYSDIMRTGIAV